MQTLDITQDYARCVEAWGPDSLPPQVMIRAAASEETVTGRLACAVYPCHFRSRVYQQLGMADGEYGLVLIMPFMRAYNEVAGRDAALREMHDSIVHELAHIACGWQGYPEDNHSPRWQRLMITAGYSSRATARDPRLDICAKRIKANPGKYVR